MRASLSVVPVGPLGRPGTRGMLSRGSVRRSRGGAWLPRGSAAAVGHRAVAHRSSPALSAHSTSYNVILAHAPSVVWLGMNTHEAVGPQDGSGKLDLVRIDPFGKVAPYIQV